MSLPATLPALSASKHHGVDADREYGFVTFRINEQLFGIAVEQVQDVLRRQRLTPIPLAPKEITGAVNLRGRIVTVINLREKLGIHTPEGFKAPMNIVVEHRNELFSLWVDSVGDVLNLPGSSLDKAPSNLSSTWHQFVRHVHQLEKELLLILDVASLIKI
jgi:purine-binding chemotaxis protein CheW